MENLKYLLLLFLFSCNASDEEMYQLYSEQFETSNSILEKENDKTYKQFYDFAHDEFDGSIPFFQMFYNETQSLKSIADSISYNIKIMRNEKLAINSRQIVKLQKLFNSLKVISNNIFENFIFNKNKKRFQNLIDETNDLLEPKNWDRISFLLKKNANENKIDAVLMKMKNDIIKCENNLLGIYVNSIHYDNCKFYGSFNIFESHISKIIKKDEEYKMTLFYAFHDTLVLTAKIKINDKFIPIKKGIGVYEKKCFASGEFKEKGILIIRNPNTLEEMNYPFEIKYTVTEK